MKGFDTKWLKSKEIVGLPARPAKTIAENKVEKVVYKPKSALKGSAPINSPVQIYDGLNEFKCRLNKISVKPLSVNRLFQGRRFRTEEYDIYEKEILRLLPDLEVGSPPYKVTIVFGLSNNAADADNYTKAFIDIAQKRYNFNDKYITELHIYKRITAKKEEYISFNIETL